MITWANSQYRHQVFDQIVKIPSLNTSLDPPAKTTGSVSTDFNILSLLAQKAQFSTQLSMAVSILSSVDAQRMILLAIYMIS